MCEGDDANDARLLWNDATEAHDAQDEKTNGSLRTALEERKKTHARETQIVFYTNFFLPTDVVFCPALVSTCAVYA